MAAITALIRDILKGDSTRARSMRSTGLVVMSFAGQNLLRLTSNLILTRLLFPEAFGLMALVQIFMIGLQMFSDLGINLSIMQHKRGEERAFLDTAWTVQIIRGFLLWLASCALALPAAKLYNEPQLAYLIPATGFAAVITGFMTTKVAVANRNLRVGVQVGGELGSQLLGMIITVALAMVWPSVWALVIGWLCAATIQVLLMSWLLPGPGNRLCWDRDAVGSLIHFGKYIFLSSIAGFLANQGDRAVLGGFVSMADLGIYSAAYMISLLPLQLAQVAGGKVVFPIYRKYLDLSVPEDRRRVFKARRMILAVMIVTTAVIALVGVPLIHLLYDPRYSMAGPILVLFCMSITIQLAASLYDGAYLAHGDSRSHFLLNTLRAVIQTVLLFVLVSHFGVIGAVAGPAVAVLLIYPVQSWVVNRFHAWDPLMDAVIVLVGTAAVVLSWMIWKEDMMALLAWAL